MSKFCNKNSPFTPIDNNFDDSNELTNLKHSLCHSLVLYSFSQNLLRVEK
jgi:hypothetical protein